MWRIENRNVRCTPATLHSGTLSVWVFLWITNTVHSKLEEHPPCWAVSSSKSAERSSNEKYSNKSESQKCASRTKGEEALKGIEKAKTSSMHDSFKQYAKKGSAEWPSFPFHNLEG